MNFLQRTPFLRILLALVAGIILYQFFYIPNTFLLAAFLFAAILIIASFFIKSSEKLFKNRWIFGAGVFLLLSTLGYWFCKNFENKNAFSSLNEKSIFKAELISAPVEKTNSYQCKIKLLQKFDTLRSENAYGKAIIYLQKEDNVKNLRIGDKLLVSAEFKTPDGIQNPSGFDYARYLKRQGILATAYISSENWEKSNEKPTFSLRRIADNSRNYLLAIYRTFGISGDEFAVLAALTLGYTDELHVDLKKEYSEAGATHILAISGLHVGIVYVVLSFLFGFLDKTHRKKILKAVIIITFLWTYAFITGLSPAVIRASLMFSFVSLATILNRKSQIYNTIFMSAFLMLLFKPNLLFEIGFQLSYAAVLSIVFFQPQISKWISPKNKVIKWSWDLVAVSIAAQLGTAPFTLYYFHQFPNFFLLTNFIAIPLATLVIYLAIALFAFSFLPILPNIIAFLLKSSLWLLNFSIEKVQQLPFSISYISLDYRQVILVFTALLFIIAYFHNKKFSVLVIGLCSFLMVTGIFVFQKYRMLNTDKMIIFSDSRVPIINFIHRGENYVYTTDSVRAEKITESFWKSNLLQKPVFTKENRWLSDGFAFYGGKKILILTDNSLKNKISETPLKLDYLIISNKIKPKIESILSCLQPKMIIVDKSISAWYTNHIKEICKTNNIEFYSVAEKGAFVLNLDR